MRRVHVILAGHVQGVGFRWICAQEARARGVRGFIRNLPDGRVEAAFEGPEAAVEGMLDWARRGPTMATVDSLDVEEEVPAGDVDFEIRR